MALAEEKPMTYAEHIHHFMRLLDGEDGSPVTPPGTPPPPEAAVQEEERKIVAEDIEAAEDERCGRLIR